MRQARGDKRGGDDGERRAREQARGLDEPELDQEERGEPVIIFLDCFLWIRFVFDSILLC